MTDDNVFVSGGTDSMTADGSSRTDELHDAMPTSRSVELDWSSNEEVTAEIAKVGATFGVDAEVVNPHGPGGGNPVVRFSGHPMRLGALLWTYFTGTVPVDDEPDASARDFLEFVR